jgi:hypothetical protein
VTAEAEPRTPTGFTLPQQLFCWGSVHFWVTIPRWRSPTGRYLNACRKAAFNLFPVNDIGHLTFTNGCLALTISLVRAE